MLISEMYELAQDYPELPVFVKKDKVTSVKEVLNSFDKTKMDSLKLKIFEIRNDSGLNHPYPVAIFLSTRACSPDHIDMGSSIFLPCKFIDLSKI